MVKTKILVESSIKEITNKQCLTILLSIKILMIRRMKFYIKMVTIYTSNDAKIIIKILIYNIYVILYIYVYLKTQEIFLIYNIFLIKIKILPVFLIS